MERLTHERVNGIKTGYWSAATKEVLVQKLAAYENTGYEPDEIRAAIEQAAKSSETKTATVMAECIAGALKDTLEKYGTAGDGGILTMPLRDNVPEPPTDDWQLTTCPVCGAECWQTDTARRILALEPDVRTACTACALKGLGK